MRTVRVSGLLNRRCLGAPRLVFDAIVTAVPCVVEVGTLRSLDAAALVPRVSLANCAVPVAGCDCVNASSVAVGGPTNPS